MRALLFSRYGRLGASSRLRLFQYEPYLRDVQLAPVRCAFFDDEYLSRRYGGGRTGARALAGFWRRIDQMRRIRRDDLVWIEKEALPWLPWAIERALLHSRAVFVTDYDDAVFHNYDLHPSPHVRRLLGRKIDDVMRASTLVIAGNAYLAERAERAGAEHVVVVPTVIDLSIYGGREKPKRLSQPIIGWMGTPSTWTEYMAPMMPVLAAITSDERARICAVGAGKAAAAHPLLDNRAWSEETEVARIQEMDIGIMPLTDTPWARGKCGYKLIQYMACGLPVVASPVGVNAEIVEHGVNGFLANTPAEWLEALVTLLRDPDLRHRMGAAGRRKVEAEYSLQIWGPRVARMLKDVVESRRS